MTRARFSPSVSRAIPVALLWLSLAAAVGNAAERAPAPRGPKLEGDVYKGAVRIDWNGTGEKESREPATQRRKSAEGPLTNPLAVLSMWGAGPGSGSMPPPKRDHRAGPVR